MNYWQLAFGCCMPSSSAPTLLWFNLSHSLRLYVRTSSGHDKSISEVMMQHISYFSPVHRTSYPVKGGSQTGLMWLVFEKSTSDIFAFHPADAYEFVNNSCTILLGTKVSLTGLSSLPSTSFSLSFCCLLFSSLLGSPLPPSLSTQR